LASEELVGFHLHLGKKLVCIMMNLK
jgi:hypothetical protein